jgi:hypothetical protein
MSMPSFPRISIGSMMKSFNVQVVIMSDLCCGTSRATSGWWRGWKAVWTQIASTRRKQSRMSEAILTLDASGALYLV